MESASEQLLRMVAEKPLPKVQRRAAEMALSARVALIAIVLIMCGNFLAVSELGFKTALGSLGRSLDWTSRNASLHQDPIRLFGACAFWLGGLGVLALVGVVLPMLAVSRSLQPPRSVVFAAALAGFFLAFGACTAASFASDFRRYPNATLTTNGILDNFFGAILKTVHYRADDPRLDELQKRHKCCGFHGFEDWLAAWVDLRSRSHSARMTVREGGEPMHWSARCTHDHWRNHSAFRACLVPRSCCHDDSSTLCGDASMDARQRARFDAAFRRHEERHGSAAACARQMPAILARASLPPQDKTKLYTRGCIEAMVSELTRRLRALAILLATEAIASVAAAFSLLRLRAAARIASGADQPWPTPFNVGPCPFRS